MRTMLKLKIRGAPAAMFLCGAMQPTACDVTAAIEKGKEHELTATMYQQDRTLDPQRCIVARPPPEQTLPPRSPAGTPPPVDQ